MLCDCQPWCLTQSKCTEKWPYLFDSNILLTTLFSNTFSLYSSLKMRYCTKFHTHTKQLAELRFCIFNLYIFRDLLVFFPSIWTLPHLTMTYSPSLCCAFVLPSYYVTSLRPGLRTEFGPRREKVKLEVNNEELHVFCSSLNRVIKSMRTKWPGYVAWVEEMRNTYKILVAKPEGKRALGELDNILRRSNIKMDLNKTWRAVWAGLTWFKITNSGGLLWTRHWNHGFCKTREISSLQREYWFLIKDPAPQSWSSRIQISYFTDLTLLVCSADRLNKARQRREVFFL
jgi:hypothetical protein